jgi:BirA family biotin operon repressor/biotin-[acetyl-CoA-carboxylase] ligase
MHDDIESFLKKHLNTSFVGKQIYYYESVTSTMEIAKRLAREAAVEGTIIIADKQTAGKGRLSRIWLSPANNLAISIVLRPTLMTMLKLIMVASVAAVRAIKEVTDIDAQIKWPNDVMIKGKKVCGILIENEFKGDKPNFSIIGIGMNINLNPSIFPEIASLATSLLYETGHEIPRTELVRVLLLELEKLYLQAQDGDSVYEEWQRNMETLGKVIRVQSGDTVEQGKAEAVTKNGNLVLRHSDGSISEIVAGDVTILKD